MSIPERCRDPRTCKSPARQGCTVKAMQQQLRGKGIQNMWQMRKAQLCDLIAAPKAEAPKPEAKAPKPEAKVPKPEAKAKVPKPESVPEPNPGKYIWGDVKYLSGPVSATVFEISKGRRIYIFGDDHTSKRGQCWSWNSVSIAAVLQRLCNDKSRDVDVFLESVPNETGRVIKGLSSPMIDAIRLYASETNHHKGTKKCHARFHWTNTRLKASWGLNFDHAKRVDDFVQNIDCSSKLRDLMDAFLTSNHWKQQVFGLWPGFYMAKSNADKDHFVTGKEFNRLSSKQQKLIKDYIADFFAHYDFLSDTYYRNFVARYHDPRWKNVVKSYMSLLTLILEMLLMDVYLLSRLLKFLDKQTTNGISVIFCGESHCIHYIRFLTTLYGRPAFHNRTYREALGGKKKNISYRCVDVHCATSSPVMYPVGTLAYEKELKRLLSSSNSQT